MLGWCHIYKIWHTSNQRKSDFDPKMGLKKSAVEQKVLKNSTMSQQWHYQLLSYIVPPLYFPMSKNPENLKSPELATPKYW